MSIGNNYAVDESTMFNYDLTEKPILTVNGPTLCKLTVKNVFTKDNNGNIYRTKSGAPYLSLQLEAENDQQETRTVYDKVFNNSKEKLGILAKAAGLTVSGAGCLDVSKLKGASCLGEIDNENYTDSFGNPATKVVVKKWIDSGTATVMPTVTAPQLHAVNGNLANEAANDLPF